MTRTQLVKKMAEKAGCTRKVANNVLTALQDAVLESVAAGERIVIPGFLTFEKKHVDEKIGKDYLHGGENEWTKPARDLLVVKVSKTNRELC